jgi:hypothetical protein
LKIVPAVHRELIATGIAVKLVALNYLRNFVRLAAGAGNLIGPTKRLKISAAAICASELFNQAAKANGVCSPHLSHPTPFA